MIAVDSVITPTLATGHVTTKLMTRLARSRGRPDPRAEQRGIAGSSVDAAPSHRIEDAPPGETWRSEARRPHDVPPGPADPSRPSRLPRSGRSRTRASG